MHTAEDRSAESFSYGGTQAYARSLTRQLNETLESAVKDLEDRVMASYTVLESCPWVVPRPLYIIAVQSEYLAPDNASMYLVQAKVEQEGTGAELSMVLGMDSLQVSTTRDGVVAFNLQSEAEAFSLHLEREQGQQAMVATFNSHELFRLVDDVHGVVVYLGGETGFVPTPMQLATYVRGADAWDQA